jgi:hypothetical protein
MLKENRGLEVKVKVQLIVACTTVAMQRSGEGTCVAG